MTLSGPRPIHPDQPEWLHRVDSTRLIEEQALARYPAGTLMARAGASVARLLRAWQPHARQIDVVCGPGNNGGDGLVAATELHRHLQAVGHGRVRVWLHLPGGRSLPGDADRALQQARAAGVDVMALEAAADGPWPWSAGTDVLIDALLGIGARPLTPGPTADIAAALAAAPQPVLCVDTPSGLDPDTGQGPAGWQAAAGPRATLSLLTLKPGLLTGQGRDRAGDVWLDRLGVGFEHQDLACAIWGGWTPATADKSADPHSGHKGSYGDVAVMPGQPLSHGGQGMGGAAALAACAALHAGAGRVYLGVADEAAAPEWDPLRPELMLRRFATLAEPGFLASVTVVAGCGGGSVIGTRLLPIIEHAGRLVLDADGLNALAADPALQLRLRARGPLRTVITPHPLEAARLLGCSTQEVMADRLRAASELARRLQVVCVLKGAGTVVAAPDALPWINGTGNARLATAGTGDVLAGLLGAAIARRPHALLEQTRRAVHLHGQLADAWDSRTGCLTAGALAACVRPV